MANVPKKTRESRVPVAQAQEEAAAQAPSTSNHAQRGTRQKRRFKTLESLEGLPG